MFRRNKENKAKLEHKLYLARENPEPVFDLTDCNLRNVPQGIYSLCRVFLKETLDLQNNCLSSLRGGGQLQDLRLLKHLNISNNAFSTLPDDIHLLQNLQVFYINNNQLKVLPQTICNLSKLRLLDLTNNALRYLPENMGNLSNLRILKVCGNKQLTNLPKSICEAQRLHTIELDGYNFIYPPKDVTSDGTESIMKFICSDRGLTYVNPNDLEDVVPEESNENISLINDTYQAKIWELEKIKQQKMQEFLEIEKNNELMQRQEIELANSQKANRVKLLADISERQNKFDTELTKLQQIKEFERFRLIEQLQETEQTADIAIKQLLAVNNEPLAQLLEQEKEEEERLIAAAFKYSETLRKDDILKAMENILQQETEKFEQFHQSRMETSKNILEEEMETDSRLLQILENQDIHKAELVSQLQDDITLQKAAVCTLLERADARSWGLVQQVRLVEAQLLNLTTIEMDRRKLEIDDHINDLAEKRINLSMLLIDLLDQQRERRSQLLSTLQTLEESNSSIDDFWLKQYQNLLDKLPHGISEAQKNIDPAIAQALLVNGVIHLLPFLAKLIQCHCHIGDITDDDLLEAGVVNKNDRLHILDAFQMIDKEKMMLTQEYSPSAPSPSLEEASAPLPDYIKTINTSECVVCMEYECHIIFVPCGHLCCCITCSSTLTECPMCRASVERKIKIVEL